MYNIRSVFLFLLFLLKNKQEINAYNVALVEYLMEDAIIAKLSPLDLGNRNARVFSKIVRNIKEENDDIDLILFPESALVSNVLNNPEGRQGMTFVPDSKDGIIPCNNTSNEFSNFFKLLSCTAEKYRTYLVVNLKEKYCSWSDCDSNQLIVYNTDVVFDRNGKVIARYRKYNLFGELGTNTTKEPELITFDTDFGKTFGIFTCFDILFQSPPVDLVRNGVNNFVFPTYWFPELPFLSTIQAQQMWAQGTNVTFLTAGASHPKTGSGALGIFLGEQGNVATIVSPSTYNRYLLREVPERINFNSTCSTDVNDDKAREMDEYQLSLEDLSEYSYKKLNIESSETIEETLCQEQNNTTLCCKFEIETLINKTEVNDIKNEYNYFLTVRSGYRTHAKGMYKTSMEICALIACTGDSIKSCGKRFPKYDIISWPVTFERIKISAEFPNTEKRMQFPNSLLADFSPIQSSCTTWKKEENKDRATNKLIFSTEAPVTKLLTYAIYGRNFALD